MLKDNLKTLRKNKGLSQEELSIKLNVVRQTISKWETGLSVPDAGKMLDLCNILEISVNELLNGERIDMKDYEKKTEELLLEMARQDELKNKRLITNMLVLTITDFIFYVSLILLACITLEEGFVLGTIIFLATTLFVAIAFYAFKLEVDAGYYECKNCHHRYIPESYFKALMAPHMHTTRYMKCPKCHKKTWSKKVMTKE